MLRWNAAVGPLDYATNNFWLLILTFRQNDFGKSELFCSALMVSLQINGFQKDASSRIFQIEKTFIESTFDRKV